MKKAILIGNGMTSQIIDNYTDKNMMNKLKGRINELYDEINGCLEPLRKLSGKDDYSVIAKMKEQGISDAEKCYQQFFVDYKLRKEMYCSHIISIEALLKVAKLYHHVIDNGGDKYNKIKSVANGKVTRE